MEKEYSVLMSVYARDNPLFFRQSVESIFSQSIKPSEFILVIDGPVDSELSEEIESLKNRFNIKLAPIEKNVGLAKALNFGLEFCTNEIVARMDSDDIAFPNRIETQLNLMENSGADIISAPVLEFDGSIDNITAKKYLPKTHEEILKYARKRNPFNHPAVMFKKSVILENGGYSDYTYFEDYELFVRCLLNGAKGENSSEPLLYMRAGNGMYKRRGGRAYVGYTLRFYNHMKEIGMCSIREKLFCVYPRILVALMPTKLREFIYKNLLRG